MRKLAEDAKAFWRGKSDRAIGRIAAEPIRSEPSVRAVAEALRRQSDAAAAEARAKEAVRLPPRCESTGNCRERACSKDFVRARMLAERALH